MSSVLRIAVHGTGRMARAIAEAAADSKEHEVVALAGRSEPGWQTDIPYAGKLEQLQEPPDLLIDFSLPEGTRDAASWCTSLHVPLVSGVTALPEDVRAEVLKAAQVVPVLLSANLSLGVNLLADLAARAATVLGRDTPVEIEDIHHQWKKDAPSGTALMLGAAIAGGSGADPGAIRYRSVREGEVIGDHTVTFRMNGEELTLGHRAGDRSIFARGALKAGSWLVSQPPGLYSARDWLRGG